MSTYEVNRFCYLLNLDVRHRDAARTDLVGALRSFDLTAEERRAVVEGDVGWLLSRGVHPLLLVRLCMHGIAGLSEETYAARVRAAPVGEGAHG